MPTAYARAMSFESLVYIVSYSRVDAVIFAQNEINVIHF